MKKNKTNGCLNKETAKIIHDVCTSIASDRWIPGYSRDDIFQQAYVIAMEGLANYDNKRSLENFLFIHVKNKLKSLRRTKYHIPGCTCGKCAKCVNNERKHNINYCVDIDDVNDAMSVLDNKDTSSEVEQKDLLDYIDKYIPTHIRDDYLRVLAGVSIPQARKQKVIRIVEELILG